MARLGSLRAQLRGRRFLLERLDSALLGHPPQDPFSDQRLSYRLGCLIAVAVLIAAAAMAVFKPAPALDDAPLVMSRQSGALYVRVGSALHPVANLTSARLILGAPVTPQLVDDDRLGSVERGPMLGISGAPHQIGSPISPSDVRWTVCDNDDRTTLVAVGHADDVALVGHADDVAPVGPANRVAAVGDREAILVRAAHGDQTAYLLYDGGRAAIDPGDPVLERTFHLAGLIPRPVSSALLNLIPEVTPIAVPRIPGAGQPSMMSGILTGTVLSVARTGADEHYVTLRDGLQRVGQVVADLLRFADPHAAAEIVTVAPDVVAGSPLVDVLPTVTYPDQVPTVLDPDGWVCAEWSAGRTAITHDAAPSEGAMPLGLARADGDGPAVDFVSLPRGHSVDVTATSPGDMTGPGDRYLITDAGVRYSVADSQDAAALGLSDRPTLAPRSLIAALPEGPELNRAAALFAQDVLGVLGARPAAPE